MQFKKYEIKYVQMVKPSYKVINPYDMFDVRNMDERIMTVDHSVKTQIIHAPNKDVAKGLLAAKIYENYIGHGLNVVKPIIVNALMNIESITEVGDDE